MKRMLMVFLAVCFVVGVGIYCINQNSNGNGSNDSTDYMVFINNDDIMTRSFEGYPAIPSLPDYAPSLPIDRIEEVNQLDCVESVLPYYALSLYLYGESFDLLPNFKYKTNLGEGVLDSAIQATDAYGSKYDIPSANVKVVYNDDHYRTLDKSNIVKSFKNTTGVFISKDLFEQMGLNDDVKTLVLTTNVYVPIYATMVEETDPYPMMAYRPSEYQMVEVELEVEGVLDAGYSQFISSTDIVVPYQQVVELHEEVFANLNAEEGKTIYQPNGYIVRCKANVAFTEFGKQLQEIIGDCIVAEYEYGRNCYYSGYYLFTKDDMYKF